MSNNKFDALGSDDSEGEGDPGQTLVEVRVILVLFGRKPNLIILFSSG